MRPTRDALVAATLSLLVPGTGHLYLGERRRASLLLTVSAVIAVAGLALVALGARSLALSGVDATLLAVALVANAAVLGFRLFAVVDSWRAAAAPRAALAAVVVLGALAAAPHVAAGYVAARGYGALDEVFADDEPRDVLHARGVFLARSEAPARQARPRHGDAPADRPFRPRAIRERATPFRGEAKPLADATSIVAEETPTSDAPWVTILLIGSDQGPGQPGDRTDTMIVAALQRETHRAVLFGVPRNLVGVPIAGVAGTTPTRFPEPLNALYAWARRRPELFPGGGDPGATALKQTISRLLGIRVDYHAFVDLDGFVDLVDALGGVRIRVKERIVDEVTRPEWRETKPRIDVYPGRTYLFTGRTALAYVRSRKASNDYRRMARQRCFLAAMAQQLDVVSVLRHFGSLANAVEENVRTDVPLDRAPDLARLAADVDSRLTLTETFGPPYIAGRRARDRYPYPNVAKIQQTVRDAILDPNGARARRKLSSVRASC